jgi:hypothetical protein
MSTTAEPRDSNPVFYADDLIFRSKQVRGEGEAATNEGVTVLRKAGA